MLKITNISKTFNPGTINEKKALTNLSLHLDKGDFVTILGSNGAGKSTLFNAIAGTFPVDSGDIRLDGQNITSLPDFKRSKFIGRMFQDPLKGTAPSMTIEENLAEGSGGCSRLRGLPLHHRHRPAARSAQRVPEADLRHHCGSCHRPACHQGQPQARHRQGREVRC